ncbi:LPS export ABC transporter periplasmic protein LptC [Methylobacter sp. BBA5.1]|uniref:LPS export ABC transporter periplasmic protein LptC n=1 Tax=Methylobacter sp. BBA5.1 TaxID=1495064 RepID=UPI00055F3E14|nr:LPS export ABC transporter periplasmic protein LptC [Methylobacter sp. BBA5.1]
MISLNGKYIYLYIAIIAVMSWWLVKLTGVDEVRAPAPDHSPDYFSKGYTKWEMDETGKLKNKLLADKMTHYNDDGTTHLENPVMFFHKEKTPPWVVKSEAGILSADGKDLLLTGKVNVERAKGEDVNQLIINTSNVRVKPETSYAETDEWAELISPPNVTTGTGMKLVFSNPINIKLLANVRGKYETH